MVTTKNKISGKKKKKKKQKTVYSMLFDDNGWFIQTQIKELPRVMEKEEERKNEFIIIL